MKQTHTEGKLSLRLHPILVKAVAQALFEVFIDERRADKVIEYALKQNPKAGSSDRAFVAETTYDIVRYFRLYTELLERQPRYMNDFWEICGIHFIVKGIALPEWREFKDLNPEKIRKQLPIVSAKRSLRESLPEWLDQLCEQELGENWETVIKALNEPARVVLRVNTLKTNRALLQKQLADEGIATEPFGDADTLVLTERRNVSQTKAFKYGLFEVQDFSSQQVAPFLQVRPGMRVVDACAGAGGKTLHLAALMQNKGSLIALDIHAWKLDELRQRTRRAGVGNVETRAIENRKTVKRLYDSADRLLLDVPCSGMGVLRRNPDTKWKLNPEYLAELRQIQQDILQNYTRIVKPGGIVVYATCSILSSENRGQVDAFLNSPVGAEFRLLREQTILPHDQGFDGFYMAALERVAEGQQAQE